MLDRETLYSAFDRLGRDLADRGLFGEIAVHGGSAIMLQFAWRRGTEDVVAVVRQRYDEDALRPSVSRVAQGLGLPPGWLNDAVGMVTPLVGDENLCDTCGTFPSGNDPGLRVVLDRPHDLLAMKRKALSNVARGDRDLRDARALASHLGIGDADSWRSL